MSSPFEAFARYERENGLPPDAIRQVNATNHHDNAWARLERNEVSLDLFCSLFEQEAAALGYNVSGDAILGCLTGEVRPEMVAALDRLKERLPIALLTNNFLSVPGVFEAGNADQIREIVGRFDVVVESSKVGVRKPQPQFYEIACELLAVEPENCVFLDDLGVNLKPARAMGMTTIKVEEPSVALAELEKVVGFALTNSDEP